MNDFTVRLSTKGDLETLKALWVLAFGDDGSYIENYFSTYHRPERMFVAEKEGRILAMTATFEALLQQEGETFRFAYLYAVATHPDFEKQGIASGLLEKIYEILQGQGYDGVATVPATPSLHKFFQKNRFRDYFVEYRKSFSHISPDSNGTLTVLSGAEYAQERGAFLKESKLSWVEYAPAGLDYQKSLGELYRFTLGDNSCIFALEQAEGDFYICKECVGDMDLVPAFLSRLQGTYPLGLVEVRHPLPLESWEKANFGMIYWFSGEATAKETALLTQEGYLGFAFD